MSPLATKIWKNIFSWKEILKNLSEYICRQLKYHQCRIRGKTGIWLEIILNVFKYSVTCSTKILTLVIAPFLLISVDALCKFTMVPSVNILLFPQEEYVRKKRYTLPQRAYVHIWQHIHQKDLNLVYHYITMPRLLLN